MKSHKQAIIKGIKKGDEILSVKDVKDLDLYTMRELLRGNEGQELFLKIRRNSKVLDGYIRLGREAL